MSVKILKNGIETAIISGPPGAPGATGQQGLPGAPGIAATIEIGEVRQGVAPDVINVGTASAAILDFVLVKGDTGATGPEGPQGQPGTGVQFKGEIADYTELSGITGSVNGDMYYNLDNGLCYIFENGAFPSESDGIEWKGDKGDKGDTGEKGDPGNQAIVFANSAAAQAYSNTHTDVLCLY